MDWQKKIVINPKILVGKPIIKGTRIAVEHILEMLAEGWTYKQIIDNYPQLTQEDIKAAIHYATQILKEEKIYPLTGT